MQIDWVHQVNYCVYKKTAITFGEECSFQHYVTYPNAINVNPSVTVTAAEDMMPVYAMAYAGVWLTLALYNFKFEVDGIHLYDFDNLFVLLVHIDTPH